MTERIPPTGAIRNAFAKAHPFPRTTDIEERYEEFDRWLNEIRAEAWDSAWREIRMIPHWWNTEDQYGEFDMQPLGPDETSEQGAFMVVRETMLDNPYREPEK